MRTVFFVVFMIFIQIYKVFCVPGFGSVFPVPLSVPNDDPSFQQCPMESGAYPHTTNCSLFHMCTFGIHTIYSCIDEFFFNPTSGKCQYFPIDKEMTCTTILEQMKNTDLFPVLEGVKGYDDYHWRKSAQSQCTQNGIYPDVLDCSLFHYCHQNKQHEILKCPNGLHFDPKLFMCSAPQLVNCQYEPPTEPPVTEDETDNTSTMKLNTICADYAPGTHLPIANRFDQFIICESNGKSTLMKCQPGFSYNALTTGCERRSCAMDSAVCQNNGQCIDKTTDMKGFQCICSSEYQGEYCEKPVKLVETTKTRSHISTVDLFRHANRLSDNDKSLTTMINSKTKIDVLQELIPETENKINGIEKSSAINTPLSQMLRRLNTKYENKQLIIDIIQLIFIAIIIFIGLILLCTIVFSITMCIRLILSSPVETIGSWTTLTEESKI